MATPDTASIVYAYFFVGAATVTGIWYAFRHGVHTLLDEHVTQLNKRLDRIEYQLYNNGGESMKDAVDRIELDLVILKTKLGEQPWDSLFLNQCGTLLLPLLTLVIGKMRMMNEST